MSCGSNRGKHIVIFNVWMKQQYQSQVRNRQISNMLFEISYIDKQGEIELLRRTICVVEFESMIHVMKYHSKKTFIYDATTNGTGVYKEELSFTQNGIHSTGTNTFVFQNINQNQFGRHMNITLPLNSSTYDTHDWTFFVNYMKLC